MWHPQHVTHRSLSILVNYVTFSDELSVADVNSILVNCVTFSDELSVADVNSILVNYVTFSDELSVADVTGQSTESSTETKKEGL